MGAKRMNGEQYVLIAVLLTMLFSLITLGAVVYNQGNVTQLVSDTNTLKNNDLAMAEYIQANSNTITYLNENCKVTQDNNDITVLTCIKPKVN